MTLLSDERCETNEEFEVRDEIAEPRTAAAVRKLKEIIGIEMLERKSSSGGRGKKWEWK